MEPCIASDGAGGAIIAWSDERGTLDDIYAQRMNAAGVAQWTTDGVAVCAITDNQLRPRIASDGSGGAVVTWYDNRSTTDNDVYAQRLNASGLALWPYNGVPVCADSYNQVEPEIAFIDDGVIITWRDNRNAAYGVYAQRLDGFGVEQWPAGGVTVCTTAGDALYPLVMSDGAGGALLTWHDYRGITYDIYAQRIEGRYGEWGRPEPTIASVSDNPSDQGGRVIVRWLASDRDRASDPLVSHYSVWRSTDAAALSPARRAGARVVTEPGGVDAAFSGAAIWVERSPAGPAYWEWIANQDAVHLPSYSYTAPTRQDSVAGDPALHYFKVCSHDDSPSARVWESADSSGYSVDNLAPAAPLMLTAQRSGDDVLLSWDPSGENEPDLKHYAVYRGDASGVTPTPVFFLSNSLDTMLTDADAPTSALYYIVTAYDVHDNQGPPSNEAMVDGAGTGVGDTPRLTALQLRPNAPNPFSGQTVLEIGLPAAAEVTVEIYDVAGRRVRALTRGLGAGWQRLAFDGRDGAGRPLASGVYFCRVSAAGETRAQKMVIRR
jgi:hypothetical protein